MEKIIFLGLVIPIFGFVLYLGATAIMNGFSAKSANKINENSDNEKIDPPLVDEDSLSHELEKLNKLLILSEKKTSKNTKLQINLALNYGSKFEIIDAVKKLCKNNKKITEYNLSKNLQTKNIPDPDLMIRTSGEFRLSNFLLWQSAYTEIYMTNAYWPSFREQQLIESINDYQNRERRFGKVSDQIKAL